MLPHTLTLPYSPPTLQHPDTGRAIMPSSRSHCAPYFSGQVRNPIEDFFGEYEELANCCGLTDRQKVETVIRYIPFLLRDFWKSLDGYKAHDWTDFRRELEGIYERPSAFSRRSEQKLRDFVRDSSEVRMSGEEDVLLYYRQFLVLSKPLLDSQRLTTYQRNKMFWRGFHRKDRAEMYTRLIAMRPDQYPSDPFDYLDVYKIARITISGNHWLHLELDDPCDEPQSLGSRPSQRAQERRLDQEEHDPRGVDPSYRTYEHRRLPSITDDMPRNSQRRRIDTRRSPSAAEAKVDRSTREQELEDLMDRMHGLSVWEESYVMLWARCTHQFPKIAQNLPKPDFVQYMRTPAPAPVPTFSPQASTPPPPPVHHPSPVAATPPPVPQSSSNFSSHFRFHVQAEGCYFCTHRNHRLRQCLTAEEYVYSGRASIVNGRLRLPNGQPIPNDGTGRGLKIAIDSWLATQGQEPGCDGAD